MKAITSYFQVVTGKSFPLQIYLTIKVITIVKMANSIIIVNHMKPIQLGHSPIHLTTSLSTLSSDLSGVHQYKISVSVCSVCLQNSSDCSQMRTMFADKQKSTVQDIQLNPVQINQVGYLSFRDLCSYSTLFQC